MFYEFNSNIIFRDYSCGHAYISCVACDLKKEKIYSSGINIYNSDLNTSFKNSIPQVIHAEENAVHNLKASEKLKPIDIIVFRTNKNASSYLMAKSCTNCKNVMNRTLKYKNWKPRNLLYTDENGILCKDAW
mgnify:CR=1 FL=1